MMIDYTSRLYARPSFIEGMARALDMGGTLNEYNASLSGEEADAIAIWSDWVAIGQDMYAVMGDYEGDDYDVFAIEPEEELERAVA